MSRLFIGIDPGLHGGLAVIDSAFNVLGVADTPTISTSGRTVIPAGCRKPKDGRADALALAYWGTML
jgi:Holliday junction resolvasome RuvABC endonuclease subunit